VAALSHSIGIRRTGMSSFAADRALDPVALAAPVRMLAVGVSAAFRGLLGVSEDVNSPDYLSARRRYSTWPRRRIRSGRPAHPQVAADPQSAQRRKGEGAVVQARALGALVRRLQAALPQPLSLAKSSGSPCGSAAGAGCAQIGIGRGIGLARGNPSCQARCFTCAAQLAIALRITAS
jgi:hypothetical protein